MNNDWGVVQDFKLEADTRTALKNALSILMTENSKLRGYEEFTNNGIPTLAVYWADHIESMNKFIVDVTDSEHIVDTLLVWTKERSDNIQQPDIDGSIRNGFRVFKYLDEYRQNSFYTSFFIQPCWIEYHK